MEIPTNFCIEGKFKQFLHAEQDFRVTEEQLLKSQLQPFHRELIIQWIIEISQKEGLHEKTKQLAIYLLDATMQKKIVEKSKVQMLAMASLLVACRSLKDTKLEAVKVVLGYEKRENEINQFIKLIADLCLDFSNCMLPYDIAEHILHKIQVIQQFNDTMQLLGPLLDYCLSTSEFIKYKYSSITAACLIYVFTEKKQSNELHKLNIFVKLLEESSIFQICQEIKKQIIQYSQRKQAVPVDLDLIK